MFPVHNQEAHIRSIVEAHLDALASVPDSIELLVVTNNCRDDSPAICAAIAADREEVRHLDLGREGGWGRAVKAGLAAATGDLLCYTNTARTTPEMLKLALVYASVYPGVVVKANRRIRDNWQRRLGSLLYNLECRVIFDLPTWDINGTPKVFPRSFSRLLELREDGDLIDAELCAICQQEDYPLVELPVLATPRRGGESTTSYRSAWRMYWGAYRLRQALEGR